MRFFQSRPFPEGFALRSVTVRKKADGWYISIGLENKDVPQCSPRTKEEINSVVGGDLGSNKLLALSNGEQIANPQFEKRLERTKTMLLGVTQEVTANSEITEDTGNSEETSVSLETEPSNPQQLVLFEWMEEQVTGSPESPVKLLASL